MNTTRASRKSRKKPRHAAAVALVGWCVMVPLIHRKESESTHGQMHYIGFRAWVDPKAPLSKWSVFYSDSSRRNCQAVLKKFRSEANSDKIEKDVDRQRSKAMAQKLAAHAKCIAHDDPRIKRNEQIRQLQLMSPESRV